MKKKKEMTKKSISIKNKIQKIYKMYKLIIKIMRNSQKLGRSCPTKKINNNKINKNYLANSKFASIRISTPNRIKNKIMKIKLLNLLHNISHLLLNPIEKMNLRIKKELDLPEMIIIDLYFIKKISVFWQDKVLILKLQKKF